AHQEVLVEPMALERENRGHHFGGTGRRQRLVGVLLPDDRTSVRVDDDGTARGDEGLPQSGRRQGRRGQREIAPANIPHRPTPPPQLRARWHYAKGYHRRQGSGPSPAGFTCRAAT